MPGDNAPVALVTGAGSGIGRATAIKFAKAGCRVVAVDVNKGSTVETCSLLQAAVPGAECLSMQCDITSPNQVESMIQMTKEAYGQLDYACNNAGISGNAAAIHEMSLDDWDQVMSVNLRGQFICMKYQIPLMLATCTQPAMVLISSICGHQAHPGMAAYTASKFGVRGLAKAAAAEYGPRGLRVNTVSPGAIDTPLLADFIASESGAAVVQQLSEHGAHISINNPSNVCRETSPLATTGGANESDAFKTLPLRGVGNADEVADAVVWLCMQGGYVTGTDLLIDGGAMARVVT